MENSYIRARINDPYLCPRFYIPIAHVVFVSFVAPFSHPLLVLPSSVFSLFALSSERSTIFLWSAYINDWPKGRCAHRERKKGPVLWQWLGYKNLRKGTSEANCWIWRNNLLFIDLNRDFSHRNWRYFGVNGFQQRNTRNVSRVNTVLAKLNFLFLLKWYVLYELLVRIIARIIRMIDVLGHFYLL